jgi:hypothetical protein
LTTRCDTFIYQQTSENSTGTHTAGLQVNYYYTDKTGKAYTNYDADQSNDVAGT